MRLKEPVETPGICHGVRAGKILQGGAKNQDVSGAVFQAPREIGHDRGTREPSQLARSHVGHGRLAEKLHQLAGLAAITLIRRIPDHTVAPQTADHAARVVLGNNRRRRAQPTAAKYLVQHPVAMGPVHGA